MKEEDVIQYFLKCTFCNQLKTVKEAALEEWQICNGCQLIFCKECKSSCKQDEMCPGAAYTEAHFPLFNMLPIEQIIEVTKNFERKPGEGRFLSKIFFEDEKKKGNLLMSSKKRDKKDDFSIIRYREEQWRKFGTVLVKRKGGQFISWGQVD